MTTEIAITNFQLPGNVQDHPGGFILPPRDGTKGCLRWIYGFLTLACLGGLILQASRGSVPWIIIFAAMFLFCGCALFLLSFSTTLIFHVNERRIEQQTSSSFSCISVKIAIFHFEGISRIIQQYGRHRALWLETSDGTRLNLSWWSHWETQPEWGTWLNRMGLNLPLRFEDTFR